MANFLPTKPQPLIYRDKEGGLRVWEATANILSSLRSRFAILALSHCEPNIRNSIIKLLLDESSNVESASTGTNSPIASTGFENQLSPRGIWIQFFPPCSAFLNRMVLLAFQSDDVADNELLSYLMQISSQLVFVSASDIRGDDIRRIVEASKLTQEPSTHASPSKMVMNMDQNRLLWLVVSMKPHGGDKPTSNAPPSTMPADGSLETTVMQSPHSDAFRNRYPRRECISIYPGFHGLNPEFIPKEIKPTLMNKLRLSVLSAVAILDGPGLVQKTEKICAMLPSSVDFHITTTSSRPNSPHKSLIMALTNTSFNSPSNSVADRVRAVSGALGIYRDGMERELGERLPVGLNLLSEVHNRNQEAALRFLHEQAGTPEDAEGRSTELTEKIARYENKKLCGGVYYEWWSRNDLASRQFCRNLVDELRPEVERISRLCAGNPERFQQERDKLVALFKRRGKGPVKLEIMREFSDECDRIYHSASSTNPPTLVAISSSFSGISNISSKTPRGASSTLGLENHNHSQHPRRPPVMGVPTLNGQSIRRARDETQSFDYGNDSRSISSFGIPESPGASSHNILPSTPSSLVAQSSSSRQLDSTFGNPSPLRMNSLRQETSSVGASSYSSRKDVVDSSSFKSENGFTVQPEKALKRELMDSRMTLEEELALLRKRAQDAEMLLIDRDRQFKSILEERLNALAQHYATQFGELKRELIELQNQSSKDDIIPWLTSLQNSVRDAVEAAEHRRTAQSDSIASIQAKIDRAEKTLATYATQLSSFESDA